MGTTETLPETLSKVEPVRRLIFPTRNERGHIISMVELHVIPDYWDRRPSAYIHNVWTREDMRGQGHATGLVTQSVSYARELGCHKVFLLCQERNGLLRFYRRLGFTAEQLGMVRRLPQDGGIT